MFRILRTTNKNNELIHNHNISTILDYQMNRASIGLLPDPHTAMPVAKALLFSKYIETLTMAGR